MKKLSKKQKLIGFIAILIVAIIIAIVITSSIIKNNNQIANEGYFATTANADSEIIANYIKKGITIGGVTGKLESLNTFDATATAEDIAEGKVAYARGERIVGTYKTGPDAISDDDLQISAENVYYADLDSTGDITVDGVIFADLAGEEESGEWGTNGWGVYTIPAETNLKKYYIKGEYTDEHFGTGKVIAPVEETSGNDRFYVMALEDIENDYTTFYWYNSAYERRSLKGPFIETTANDFAKEGVQPTGKVNTEMMIASWNSAQYGVQNERDMWGAIQEEVGDGWFVPSKSELAAFGSAFGITNSNTYGLTNSHWSSSLINSYSAYSASFGSGCIYTGGVGNPGIGYVRLATTF